MLKWDGSKSKHCAQPIRRLLQFRIHELIRIIKPLENVFVRESVNGVRGYRMSV